jgi:hypothetical protein
MSAETDRNEEYLFWSHVPYCATKIDIAPENPDTTTVSGFFRALFLSENK